MVRRAAANFREGGPANDRLDVQRLWYLISFELWRERWMGSTRRDEPRKDSRNDQFAGEMNARLAGD